MTENQTIDFLVYNIILWKNINQIYQDDLDDHGKRNRACGAMIALQHILTQDKSLSRKFRLKNMVDALMHDDDMPREKMALLIKWTLS